MIIPTFIALLNCIFLYIFSVFKDGKIKRVPSLGLIMNL